MNFAFDIQEGWVEFVLKAEFKHSDNNSTFLSGSVLTRFAVVNFENLLDADRKVGFPPNSLETLFGIAFGHLRAILAKNVSGSRFSNVIIPVINPAPIFHELLQMNIKGMKNFKENNWLKKENKREIKDIVLAPNTKKSRV